MKKTDSYFFLYIGIVGLMGTATCFYAVFFINNLSFDKFSLFGIALAFLSFSFLAISNFAQDKRNKEIDEKLEQIIDSLNETKTSIEKNDLEINNNLAYISKNIEEISFQKNNYSLLTINLNSKKDLKRK